MKIISGTFNGTGAALYMGIGFVPDYVKIFNLEDAAEYYAEWSRKMVSAEQYEGILYTPGSAATPYTIGTGINIYRGGDKITSTSTTHLLLDKTPDKRDGNAGVMGTIHTWTMDTPGSLTGHFNAEANTTYVGEGSQIIILPNNTYTPKQTTISAMTSNGEAADEVTLGENIGSGQILYLGGMYDYIGAEAGDIMPAGFVINATTAINVSGNLAMFEAGTYN